MSTTTERQPSVQRLSMEWRKTHRRMVRAQAAEEEARAEAQEALRDLAHHQAAESKRLGVEVPADAFIFDVLALVEVGPNDAWYWNGGTNNKALPCVRYRDGSTAGSERSVTRVLAEAFGIVESDWEGILYPLNGVDDVNPWHRDLREFPAGKYRGNANRYGFAGDIAAAS